MSGGITKKPPRRLMSETFSVNICGHDIAFSLVRDPTNGELREVVFVTRGKIGQSLDLMFTDLGIALSRAIQGRNPETGE